MHHLPVIPFARRAIQTLALCAGLAVAAHGHAAVITQNDMGAYAAGGSGFAFGQSITTSAGSSWDHITFNLVDALGAAYANGSLFLLTQAYSGTVSNLGSTTAGFLASTSTITAGVWDFDDAVTLAANTRYFLYMATPFDGTRQVRFSVGNPYADGYASQANTTTSNYVNLGSVDLVFSLNGTSTNVDPLAVPEPTSMALAGLALLGAAAARRRGVAA